MYSKVKNEKKRKKEKETPLFISIQSYRTEMKLVPIIMDHCLLQFDALKFFLGMRLHGGSPPNFNFFECKTPQRNVKFSSQIAWK